MENIDPEVMSQLLRQGGLEQRGSLIQQQLEGLRNKKSAGGKYTSGPNASGLAAGLAGLGDILDGVGDAYQERQLRQQQEENFGAQDSGRSAAGEAYADANDPARMERASQLHGMSDLLRSSPQVEPGATSPDQWVSGPNGNWVNGAMAPPMPPAVAGAPMPPAPNRRMPKFAQPISPFDF